jgi:hypothetical protein
VFASDDGQASQVVEVTVSQNDEIEGHVVEKLEPGERFTPPKFRVHARIDEDAKGAYFNEKAVGADSSDAV